MQKLAHEIFSFDEFRLDLACETLFRREEEVRLRRARPNFVPGRSPSTVVAGYYSTSTCP